MKHHLFLGAVFFTFGFMSSPPAQAEDILYRLQSQAGMPKTQAPKLIPYRFTIHVNLSEFDGEGRRDVQAEVRIDPSKPAESRVSVLTSTNHNSKLLMEFLAEIKDPETSMASLVDDFWCKSVHGYEDADLSAYTVISETDTEAVLKPNPDMLTELLLGKQTDDMDKSEQKMKKKLMNNRIDGHIIVSKRNGGTKGFKVDMTRTVTFKVIVKLKTMTLEQNCAVAPNGYRYNSAMKYSVTGKAIGQEFGANHDIRISDLTPLP